MTLKNCSPGFGITPEQDAESRRLISRADALNNAYTALEDHATGKVREDSLRRTLAVLVEEKERAAEEAARYHEEIGLRPE
jgi:cell division protein FtsX